MNITPEDAELRNAQEIEAQTKLDAWLKLPIVVERFRCLEQLHYDTFRAADTDEKRTAAWMSAQAMQELLALIKGVQASGKLAAARQEHRDEQKARAARTTAQ